MRENIRMMDFSVIRDVHDVLFSICVEAVN
jgi:hypothetical protein